MGAAWLTRRCPQEENKFAALDDDYKPRVEPKEPKKPRSGV